MIGWTFVSYCRGRAVYRCDWCGFTATLGATVVLEQLTHPCRPGGQGAAQPPSHLATAGVKLTQRGECSWCGGYLDEAPRPNCGRRDWHMRVMSADSAWCVACGKMLFGYGAMLCTECGALPPGLRQPVYWDGPTGSATRCRHPERHARDCQCAKLGKTA